MEKVVILGAGGHAKVIIDIFRAAGEYELAGCTSADPGKGGVLGLKVLGDDSVLPELYGLGLRRGFVAVGDNSAREKIAKQALEAGFELVNAVSPYSYVSPTARLGAGVAVMPGVVINPDAVIGDLAIINTGATVDHDCSIGAAAHIGPGCTLAGNVSVGRGAFLGAGCKAIPKVSVGEWATVGAGAVIIGDIPDNRVAFGVPAKLVDKVGG